MDPEAIAKSLERTTNGVKAHLQNPDSYASRVEAQFAAKQLLRELQNGDDAWWEMMNLSIGIPCINLALSIGALQNLPEDGAAISAEDLAKLCGTDLALIVRPMRMLANMGIVKEASTNMYQHNRHSRTFALNGYRTFWEVMTDDICFGTVAKLGEYYSGHPKVEPTSTKNSPYAWAFGMEGIDWINVMARTPENIMKFSHGFAGGWDTVRHRCAGFYPYETLVEESAAAAAEGRVFIVDIGGNIGNDMKEVLGNFPDLKGKVVVQDRQDVLSSIPAGYLPAQVETMAHDFWLPQPIKNASVYNLKRVLHDWPDKDVETILSHCAVAMGPNSRVLISENMLPETVGEDPVVYFLDMMMFSISGKERTLSNWETVLGNAGLRLVKVYHGPVGNQCVLEAQLK